MRNIYLNCWKLFLVGILLAVAVPLTGCAEIASARSAIAKYGSDAADQTLDTAIWQVCVGTSVGAVERRFPSDEMRATYDAFCELAR
jgi:hypothetical protein